MSRHEIPGESDLNGLGKGAREDGWGILPRYQAENPWSRQRDQEMNSEIMCKKQLMKAAKPNQGPLFLVFQNGNKILLEINQQAVYLNGT